MTSAPLRGQVYRVALGDLARQPYVVVSNNLRNRKLDSVLAVRVTTSDKSNIPTAVRLTSEDPLVGFALADDIVEIFQAEIAGADHLGCVCPTTIVSLNDALAQALGLP